MNAGLTILEPVGVPLGVPASPTARERRTARRSGAHHSRRPTVGGGLGIGAVLFLVALALRLWSISRAYNLFVDEATYSEIAHSLATGKGLTEYGAPFNLHPPAVLAILAGAIRLRGATDLPMDQLILALRPASAVFGAATVVWVFAVMRLLGGRPWIAVVAAALMAVEPFAISYDSRVMLEAPTQFFVASTIGLLLLADRRARRGAPHPGRLVLLAGLACGAAFSSKETFGLVLGLTLVLLLLCPTIVARRISATVLGIGAACYAAMTIAVWCTSGFSPWWTAHTSGFSRLVGTSQTTGFHANPNPGASLTSRLAANLSTLAATYALLAVGGIITLVVLIRTRAWRRVARSDAQRRRTVLLLWAFSSCSYLAYATVFGSLEEQMYYITLAPCLMVAMSVAVGSPRRALLRRRRRAEDKPRVDRWVAVLAALVLLFDSAGWLRTHTRDNNSYEQLFSWERTHVAPGARIGVTEDLAQFVFDDAVIGKWSSMAELKANHADYVLVETSLVEQGYSAASPAFLAYLQAHAKVVFSATSDTDGTMLFFDVAPLTGTGS